MFQDITLRKKLQEKLLLLAQFDQLTGLPNRHTLFEHINRILAKAQRQRTLCALLFMDLDGFKQINDEHGHAMGDALLKSFAARVQANLRGGDILSRLAGDEFVVVVDDAASAEAVGLIASKLIDACAGAYELDQAMIHVHCSIGIALVEAGDSDADTLLRQADEAMYRAKANGKNQYSL